jgi:hypothetical protein
VISTKEKLKKTIIHNFKVSFNASFVSPTNNSIDAFGFYDGNGVYIIRFSPNEEGTWNFLTSSNAAQLDSLNGTFECVSPSSLHNKGPANANSNFTFAFATGEPYFSTGSTAYAWIHQPLETQEETLRTLREHSKILNKLRMTVFPKFAL